MKFQSSTRYRFRPRPGKYTQTPGAEAVLTKTLTYLRDVRGDNWVVHHIFQWRCGALECFTDVQMGDYLITEVGRR